MTYEQSLALARLMLDQGVQREVAVGNPAIPTEFHKRISEALQEEENIVLTPARVLVADQQRGDWLRRRDRSDWHYWPTLRSHLLGVKSWTAAAVRSLDETTDRVLTQLSPPDEEAFDIRGLVLGYVQSGKTANYTAMIAKAADVGYRLVVVLSGIDNGLRRQTQMRLKAELVGYTDRRPGTVSLPPVGRRWHEFTTEELNGDFRAGNVNDAALQGSQPVLMVVKKNGAVLRRLLRWLEQAPPDVRERIPLLVVDDEADQASVDTRGSYQTEGEELPDEYEEPSVINGLIRDLLSTFHRKAYVAYTATPFANILIPHDTVDPDRLDDLYPRDFIVDLPRPDGYFGAEQLFGRQDPNSGQQIEGLDVVRHVPDEDLDALDRNELPGTLEDAMLDYVLSGAARALRGNGDAPVTMLVHTSSRIADQEQVAALARNRFGELRDEWRYQREQGFRERLRSRWENNFRPVTCARYLDRDTDFEQVEPHVGEFFESVQVMAINSSTGHVLDYDREPSLKAIAVGGNKLSRGLTLEGLTVSFFIRRTGMYDTLMQMGRWFGFRRGYDDLTRIYTTAELAGWFNDLAQVEHELRDDIRIYETQDVTPKELCARIRQHPAMLVTSRLKQRYGTTFIVAQSYSGQVLQTVRFPFRRPDDLVRQLDQNLEATRTLLAGLGEPQHKERGGFVWTGVASQSVLDFLADYTLDNEVRSISMPLLRSYIERQLETDELVRWTIAVRGRQSRDNKLGSVDWGIGEQLHQLTRTRLKSDPNSIGVLTEPGDETIGMAEEEKKRVEDLRSDLSIGVNPAARQVRSPKEGLLLLYPVSRYSGSDTQRAAYRDPLYANPDGSDARDLIGLAVSFPRSETAREVYGEYVTGTAGWRPME